MAPTHGSFWQFQRMVKHITGQRAFFSNYGYGCYCGPGGVGVPMDDTASPVAEKLKQLSFQLVLNGYRFRVANGTVVSSSQLSPTLESNPGSGWKPPVTLCLPSVECALGPGVGCLCGLRACECDTQSASKRTCPNFKRFFSSWPRCGRSKPQC
ncbi:putative inactive group IIC secretory phospholipase A2 [Tursiops truncatus]|uniref:putative inactive group IIC secretory phospholipase A2 n=1 Tax=Tursiops truncatus TaxID=9739 RepID=UPI003CCF42ED